MKFDLNRSIEILERSPKVYKTLLSGLSEHWTTCNEGKNTWSAFDIIGHLIHGELTDWMPRTMIILSDDGSKTFEPFDRFAQKEASLGKSLDELLEEFSLLRNQNISTLKSLDLKEHDLLKTGIHPDLGIVTLKELLATWTIHDLSHLHQVSRVMVKQYGGEIGPWIKYSRIFQDQL